MHSLEAKTLHLPMSPDSPAQIAEFVRTRRKGADLSQQQLAELAGVGRNFVSELEQAKPTLRMDAVNRVLGVFGKMLGVVDAPKEDS